MRKRIAFGRLVAALAVAVTMGLSSAASAGFVGDFAVDALGLFEQKAEALVITADVFEQEPALGFTSFEAAFFLELGGDPDPFIGMFTIHGVDGDIFADASGLYFEEGVFSVLAGTFTITGGNGVFDGASGSGVIAGLFFEAKLARIIIGGTIIPAPAALALFGVAGLLTRRRRRA